MKIKFILLKIFFTVVSPIVLNAQDIHFSQFWMAPLTQNPALAGANHDLQAIVNYKDQWRSVASPYKTFDISFDMKLNRKKTTKGFCAGGINFFADKAGDAQLGTTQGNLNFAYHVFLNNHNTLGGGIMGGFGQRSINYSELQWLNQYDGTSYNSALSSGEPTTGANFTYTDLGAGLVWVYKKKEAYISGNDQVNAAAGLSVFHINRPGYSFYNTGEKLNMKIVAHGNVLYGIKNTNVSIVPGFVFYSQGSSNEILLGTLFRYTLKEASKITGNIKGSGFALGIHYRNKDAAITSAMIEIGQLTFGFSYDINLSGLKQASNGRGGAEISVRFVNHNPFLYQSKAKFD